MSQTPNITISIPGDTFQNVQLKDFFEGIDAVKDTPAFPEILAAFRVNKLLGTSDEETVAQLVFGGYYAALKAQEKKNA